MKKILLLLSSIFLLNGCAESLALLGPGASNGRFVQSSLNSAISYGVKKQTLDEIGMTSSEFDLLDGMFGGNPVDEFDEILEDLEL